MGGRTALDTDAQASRSVLVEAGPPPGGGTAPGGRSVSVPAEISTVGALKRRLAECDVYSGQSQQLRLWDQAGEGFIAAAKDEEQLPEGSLQSLSPEARTSHRWLQLSLHQ